MLIHVVSATQEAKVELASHALNHCATLIAF